MAEKLRGQSCSELATLQKYEKKGKVVGTSSLVASSGEGCGSGTTSLQPKRTKLRMLSSALILTLCFISSYIYFMWIKILAKAFF